MSDTDETRERPAGLGGSIPAGGFDLGGLAAGEYDTTLGPHGAGRAEPEPDDRLILPRGALVAFRKSGGLRFTSRTCVVYRSGRVERESLPEGPGRPEYLTPAELRRLWRLVLRAGLGRLARLPGRPSPDGYGYEIAARFGRTARYVTFDEWRVPAAATLLVRALTRLLG